MRLPLLLAFITAACGTHDDPGGGPVDDAAIDAASSDGAMADAPTDAAQPDMAPTPDAFPAVLDVRIDCHNTCVLTADPSMIHVTAGTSFQVNWINVGDTECDVAKIDQFNQVPIVLGLEPGTSYHDAVRDWCGPQFTGTFEFRISICTLPSYIPVDCGG